MLPEHTKMVYDYFEARKGSLYPKVNYFGPQICYMEHLEGCVVTKENVEEALDMSGHHFGTTDGFAYDKWMRIATEFDGKLPIEICSVREGTAVDVSNVMQTIVNTHDDYAFLPGHLETILTTYTWLGSAVFTRSRAIKNIIRKYLRKTSDLPISVQENILGFMLHDFGMRSAAGWEAGVIAGMAHLANFKGTDTTSAWRGAKAFYNANPKNIGFSVKATEHSIATALGEAMEEIGYLLRILMLFPRGIRSLVGDSYNIERFVNVYIRKYRDLIIRQHKEDTTGLTRLVVRPDSPRFEGDTPAKQVLWIMDTLWDIFGGTKNTLGYKMLHPAVGCIYGDGLNETEIDEIYKVLVENGYDVSSVVCGMGGGLLQKINRDTCRFAYKSSAQKRGDEWFDVLKNPLDKTKTSKRGRFALIKEGGEFQTIPLEYLGNRKNLLVPTFRNGEIIERITFDEVRENAELE